MTVAGVRTRTTSAEESRSVVVRRPGLATVVILAILIAAGGSVRLTSLDRLSLWADEFPHAIAARSMLAGKGPELPSEVRYRRALPQTVLVAASMRVFGENEAAARVPSAIIGLLTIPALWLGVRRRFGETAGLAAAAVLALMPLHIAHSRSARFYAAFVLAYGATAVFASAAIETRSRRNALLAVIAFGAALYLQISALMVLAPLALQAAWTWHRTAPEERRGPARSIVIASLPVAGLAIAIGVIPSWREGALRLIRNPVPGLRFGPGLHIDTLVEPFRVISWWAWIPLVPLAVAGLRRQARWGRTLVAHLLVPTTLVAVTFESTRTAGIGSRYLLHLVPFVAAIVGIACSEGIRLAALRWRALTRPMPALAVIAAVAAVSGAFGVWKLPTEPHPTKIIPRPNWNAAAVFVRAHARPGDALLSTGPLATFWSLGRCGTWLRTTEAAAPYMSGDRDINCASRLVSDTISLARFIQTHPTGWVVADPGQFRSIVDPDVRAALLRGADLEDVGDHSILVLRWDASFSRRSAGRPR